jgi:hypothetical protein
MHSLLLIDRKGDMSLGSLIDVPVLMSQVKARKEAARKDEVADNITAEQLQAIEADFMKATTEVEVAAA